ncbi:unnamed protein product [Peniophora sp. CBMAI 1063]|nr:unnamed protein product [Peniophora sp. CBMAI 1063]
MRRGAGSPSPERERARKRPRYTARVEVDSDEEDIVVLPPQGVMQGPSNVPAGLDPFGQAAKRTKKRSLGGSVHPVSASAPGPSRSTQKQRTAHPAPRASNAGGQGVAMDKPIEISSDEETAQRNQPASQPARARPQPAAARAPPASQPARARQNAQNASTPIATRSPHGRGILVENFYSGPPRQKKASRRNARAAQLTAGTAIAGSGGSAGGSARAGGSKPANAKTRANVNTGANRSRNRRASTGERSSSATPPLTISQPRRKSPPRPPPTAAGTKDDVINLLSSDDEPSPARTQQSRPQRNKAPVNHISDDEIDFMSPARRPSNHSSSDIEILSPKPSRPAPAEPEPDPTEDPLDIPFPDDNFPPPPSPPHVPSPRIRSPPRAAPEKAPSVSTAAPIPPAVAAPSTVSEGSSANWKTAPTPIAKPSRPARDAQPLPPAPQPAQVATTSQSPAKATPPPAPPPAREAIPPLESSRPARTPTPPSRSRAASHDSIEDMYAEPNPSASNRRLLDSSPPPPPRSPTPVRVPSPAPVQTQSAQTRPAPFQRVAPRPVTKSKLKFRPIGPTQSTSTHVNTKITVGTPEPEPKKQPPSIAPEAPVQAVAPSQPVPQPTQRSPVMPLQFPSSVNERPPPPSTPVSPIKSASASPSKQAPRPVGAAATLPITSRTEVPPAPPRRAASIAAWTTLPQEGDSQETDKDKLGYIEEPKEEEEEDEWMDELRASSPEPGAVPPPVVKKRGRPRKKAAHGEGAKGAKAMAGKAPITVPASQPLASPLVLRPPQAGPASQPAPSSAPLKLRAPIVNPYSQPAWRPSKAPVDAPPQSLASPFKTPAPKPVETPLEDAEMRSASPSVSAPTYVEVRNRERSGSVSLRVGVEEGIPDGGPPLVLRMPSIEPRATPTQEPVIGGTSQAAAAANAAHKSVDETVAPPPKVAEAAVSAARKAPATPQAAGPVSKPAASQQQPVASPAPVQPTPASSLVAPQPVLATPAKPAAVPVLADPSTSMPPPSTPVNRTNSLTRLMQARAGRPIGSTPSKLNMRRVSDDRPRDEQDHVPSQTSISGLPVSQSPSISPPVSRAGKVATGAGAVTQPETPSRAAAANTSVPQALPARALSKSYGDRPASSNEAASQDYTRQEPPATPAPTAPTSTASAASVDTAPPPRPNPRISTKIAQTQAGPSSAPAAHGSSGSQKRRVTWDDVSEAKRVKHTASSSSLATATASPTTSVPTSPTDSRPVQQPPIAASGAAAPAAQTPQPTPAAGVKAKPWILRYLEERQTRAPIKPSIPIVTASPTGAATTARASASTEPAPPFASPSSVPTRDSTRPTSSQPRTVSPTTSAPAASAGVIPSVPASSKIAASSPAKDLAPVASSAPASAQPTPAASSVPTKSTAASRDVQLGPNGAAPVAGPSRPSAPAQSSGNADDSSDEDLNLLYPADDSSPAPPSAHTATPSPSLSRESSVEQPEPQLRRSLRRKAMTSNAAVSRPSSGQPATRRSLRNVSSKTTSNATSNATSKATTPAESELTGTPPVPDLSRGSTDSEDEPILTPISELTYDPHSGASIKGPFYDKVIDGQIAITLTPARILHDNPPVVRYGRDLPHLLMDRMCSLPERSRGDDVALLILKSRINEETFDAEEEAPPIDVLNDIDDEGKVPPWEFYYTNEMWLGNAVPPPDLENLRGCSCKGKCDPKSGTCRCTKIQERRYMADDNPEKSGFVYDPKTGRLKDGIPDSVPIYECNDLCGCLEDCPNRVVQRGRQYPIVIKKTKQKGWGVFANGRRIPKNSYVGIYAGELLTDEEAEERAEVYDKFGRTYLLEIKYWYIGIPRDLPLDKLPPEQEDAKFVVDAYHAGNFTRFMNHSCDPNCRLLPCYINEANERKPLLTFWTTRDIGAEEELTFSYLGPPDDDEEEPPAKTKKGKGKAKAPNGADDAVFAKCCCGARNCRKVLFK